MLVSIKHNSRIVAKVVNPLGTVVTVPNEQEELSSEEVIEDAIIHENCDEALFRPVVGVRPVVCLQPKTQPLPKVCKNDKNNIKNQRYQGLKSDEIVHNIEDIQEKQPTTKRNRKSKQKQEQKVVVEFNEKKTLISEEEVKVVEQLPVKELCNSLEKILFSEEIDELKDDNKDMWSSVEKLLPEHQPKSLEDDPSKEMWSSIEHCKMDESVFAETTEPPLEIDEMPPVLFSEMVKEKSDDDLTPNNNSSETTESDDSTKNKVLVSVAETLTTEDNTATNMPISNQSVQKSTKKKAKKKRK